MYIDIKTQLWEGMKIAPIDKHEEEYTLIKSNINNCMYAVYQTTVIKLDDLDEGDLDTKWICTNLSYMEEEIKCIEYEKGKSETKIISFEDFDIYLFERSLDEYDDFQSINMRLLNMKREKYLLSKGMNYEIKLRDKIHEFYEQEKQKKGYDGK